MDIELKKALDEHGVALEKAMAQFEGQLQEKGKVDNEIRGEVKALSEKFESALDEIGQKLVVAKTEGEKSMSAGEEFVKSEQFKAFAERKTDKVRLDVKNTVTSVNGTTTFPTQREGIVAGNFLPLTIRGLLTAIPVSSNMVTSIREASWTNDAAGVNQGAAKPESDITFEQYNVAIETVAHWIKVSNQLLTDAPAIVTYIEGRLRNGLAEKIDAQLLNGNGTAPNLSGLTDTGNFTAYTATAGDNLVDAINRAKWALWATGNTPDTVIVNPADWGAMEIAREGAGTGAYLYGAPGSVAVPNAFGLTIVPSNNMAAGSFLVGNLRGSATLFNRAGAVVEMGYINDDFTKNLVTIRAEERLGLGVDRPAGILYGAFTTV